MSELAIQTEVNKGVNRWETEFKEAVKKLFCAPVGGCLKSKEEEVSWLSFSSTFRSDE